jgi:hypothetical protein
VFSSSVICVAFLLYQHWDRRGNGSNGDDTFSMGILCELLLRGGAGVDDLEELGCENGSLFLTNVM